MAQVLPGRLGRLQEAEARRLELEEAKRQEILEKAEKKKHEADLARQAREAADLQREAEAMERATSLRTRWDQADRRAAKEKKAVQRAASARISKWEKRRDKATLGLCPETLFDRLRRQMEEDGLVPKPEEPAAVKKAPPRTRKPWSRPSSARVLPKPPQELQSPRGGARGRATGRVGRQGGARAAGPVDAHDPPAETRLGQAQVPGEHREEDATGHASGAAHAQPEIDPLLELVGGRGL